ncbi:DUF2845 domain-containing protein [Catenovulum adriaticum]|uniref:DUF2845 domain-containing protein n=1 Tax=Catenovulum adriaticum TaxID=2984846 RepID=A0ABY7AQH4_9ALTE|nr:DUF2845 domain-containing protein [Catenovulum sp. TS8]WAJ71513.1 DUF2845 domain-containing protein [Catenovulum sp. TS8]
MLAKSKYRDRIFKLISFLIINLVCFNQSLAAGFRCNTGQHIKVGMSTEQVLQLCGQPKQKYSKAPAILKQQILKPKRIKVWLYHPGAYQYQQYLVINKNKIIDQIIRGKRLGQNQ